MLLSSKVESGFEKHNAGSLSYEPKKLGLDRKLVGKGFGQSRRNGSTKERLLVGRKGLENGMIMVLKMGLEGSTTFCVSAEGREYVNPEPILVPEPPPVRRLVPGGYKEMSAILADQ